MCMVVNNLMVHIILLLVHSLEIRVNRCQGKQFHTSLTELFLNRHFNNPTHQMMHDGH